MFIYIIFIFIPFTLLLKSFHWNPNSESSAVWGCFWVRTKRRCFTEFYISVHRWCYTRLAQWQMCVCGFRFSSHRHTILHMLCRYKTRCCVYQQRCKQNSHTFKWLIQHWKTINDWTFSAASPPVADVWLSAFLCQTAVFTPLNRVFLVLTHSQPIKTRQRRNKTASKWVLTLNTNWRLDWTS